ncbi:MAG TPA: pirin, partial [Bacteroidales bacterium]|nr:pirin [Bacteroidales bacterium]
PAPDSWAFDPENEVNIWLVKMQPNAVWKIPASAKATNRAVYFYHGSSIKVAGTEVKNYHKVQLNWAKEIIVENADETAYILFMQGKPIDQPVVQYGPFV